MEMPLLIPAVGPHSGHVEMMFTVGFAKYKVMRRTADAVNQDGFGSLAVPMPATGNFLTITAAVVCPLSRRLDVYLKRKSRADCTHVC